MLTFKTFIIEASDSALDTKHLKHLNHLEDHIINAGQAGFNHAVDTLHHTAETMRGRNTGHKISTKLDGSPSIVFGHHPETGKFFVASKSAFNKNPKLNYTPNDVEVNHGHAPGLVHKLKMALQHLPKIAPKKGVYQGDMMYTHDDVKTHNDHYHFKPNTITYSTPMHSEHGKKIATAKLGIGVHTKYKGEKLDDMTAGFSVDHKSFKEHPDVHKISADIHSEKHVLDPKDEAKFNKHLMAAKHYGNKIGKAGYHVLDHHGSTVPIYINHTVKTGQKPSAEGFKAHLLERGQKEIAKVKTKEAKSRKYVSTMAKLDHVDANKDAFNNIFKTHHHLQQAKNALVNSLNKTAEFQHSIGGKKSNPEGFVVSKGNRPTKLVHRHVFSAANFIKENYVPESTGDKHYVMAYGRMNPPTIGHEKLVDKVHEVAKKHNADHAIVLSHTHDGNKNPLTAEQKVKHAKRFFPKTNIKASTKEQPTLMHHAAAAHKAGYEHFHMIAGGDRVEQYKKLLHTYNRPDGDFHFKSITVHSAGDRDPDAEGATGMSASKMRAHAKNDDYTSFRKGIPKNVSHAHAHELFNDTKKGLK